MHPATPFHVLCVEDSPEDLADARRMLLLGSARRYKFTEADTGAAALRALREMTTPPDCILLAGSAGPCLRIDLGRTDSRRQ